MRRTPAAVSTGMVTSSIRYRPAIGTRHLIGSEPSIGRKNRYPEAR